MEAKIVDKKINYYVREAIMKMPPLDDYNEWILRGLELSDLGEEGRNYFQELSATSTKFDSETVDKTFTDLLKNRRGDRKINSFFKYCCDTLQIKPYREVSTSHNGFTKPTSTVTVLDKVKTFSAAELLSRKVETLPTLIDPIIPKVGIGCVAGASDTGKSAILRQLGLQIVNDDSHFLNWQIRGTRNSGIYVSTEDDSLAISFLLNKQSQAHPFNKTKLEKLQYLFETEGLLQKLDSLLNDHTSDIVVIDCLTDLFGGKGSLNESTNVRAFLNPFKELADKYECFILFLHHTGKRSEEHEPNKRHLLGSQGIEAKMRLVMELRADPVDPEIRHLCIVKGNYLPHHYKTESFELRFDDNMWFTPTGNRKPFEEIIKRSHERSHERSREQYSEQVLELSKAGASQRDIAKQLNISLGYVNKLLKSVHVHENPKETVNVNAKKDEPCPF